MDRRLLTALGFVLLLLSIVPQAWAVDQIAIQPRDPTTQALLNAALALVIVAIVLVVVAIIYLICEIVKCKKR